MAFQKGKSGNPGGRPKRGESLTDILHNVGDQPLEDGETYKSRLARILWTKAVEDKDMSAIKYIYDRIDGMPIAKQEITGEDGEAMTVKVVFDK